LEEVVGPLGEDRADWRAAWLAYWVVSAFGGVKEGVTPAWFVGHFLHTLRNRETADDEPNEIIDDDPDASARKAKELEQKLLAAFPKGD